MEKVMKAVLRNPGKTAGELSDVSNLDHVECQRRLSDLCNNDKIYKRGSRTCRVKGSTMMTWWPVN
jgi:predicted HTH transcriptional regulator